MIRAAVTAWSREGRFQGRADTRVAPEGLAQTRRAAQRLRGVQVERIVSSPLKRALDTAHMLARELGTSIVQADSRLVEIDYGHWQGATQEEARRAFTTLYRRWQSTPETTAFPGGECLLDACRRLRDFLRNPPWHASGGPVAIVTHSVPMRLAALEAAGRPLGEFRCLRIGHGAVREFAWQEGQPLREPAAIAGPDGSALGMDDARRLVVFVVTDVRLAAARGDLYELLGADPTLRLHAILHAFRSIGAESIASRIERLTNGLPSPAGAPASLPRPAVRELEANVLAQDDLIARQLKAFVARRRGDSVRASPSTRPHAPGESPPQ